MFAKFAIPLALALAACAPATEAPSDPAPPAASAQDFAAKFPVSVWPQACEDFDDWDKPGPPFAISAPDTFYVGTCGISAILIDSGDGLILIDSGTNPGADVVMANIAALGFDPADIKLLLTSHEHFDHVGGIAKIQRLTGAQLVTSAAAAEVFASGEVSPEDPQFGIIDGVAPARVDRVVSDGEVVALGNKRLRVIATPGHTHGALSWEWTSTSASGEPVKVVYADSLSPVSSDSYRFSDHLAYVAAYRESLARLAGEGPCLLVTPHPSASEMRDKLLAGDLASGMNCAQYAASLGARLDARLAEEQRAQP